MDYKKKLKRNLYVYIFFAVLGMAMLIASFVIKAHLAFMLGCGITFLGLGLLSIISYFMITKNEETIKKQQIAETDERNVLIMYKARSTAFTISTIILSITLLVLGFFEIDEITQWLNPCLGLLMITYCICYFVYRKKL